VNIGGVVEKYAKKGARILIEGSIETRKYQDQSGNVFLDDAADVLIEDDDGVPVRALFALARALVFPGTQQPYSAGDHPVNRATLIGHLGADPEKRHLNSGDWAPFLAYFSTTPPMF
jgi:hypothetical protein